MEYGMLDNEKTVREWMQEALKARSEIVDLNSEIEEQQNLLETQDKIIRDLKCISNAFADVVSSFEPLSEDEIWEQAIKYLSETNLNKETLPDRMKYHIQKAYETGYKKAQH